MMTTTNHASNGTTAAHVSAKIVMPDGSTAGEGFAETTYHAMFFACLDAVMEPETCAAGCGHAMIDLTEADEIKIRDQAARLGYSI